jgi:hypothetical protein
VLDTTDKNKKEKRTQGLDAQESKTFETFVSEHPTIMRMSYELINAVCVEYDMDRTKYVGKIDAKYLDGVFMDNYTILVKKD